jgi:SecD/SecF fusion protein
VPTVKLEFRAADEQPGPGLTEMALPGSDRKLHVDSQVLLANDAIRSARARRGEGDAWQIEIAFTEAGAARFAEITDAAVGRPLAILIDSKLVSAPVVRERIESSKAVITGAFNEAEARRIAQGLAGGQ